jgi:hypothetical protein
VANRTHQDGYKAEEPRDHNITVRRELQAENEALRQQVVNILIEMMVLREAVSDHKRVH